MAEGAADQGTVDAPAALGCDVVQGHHLSRPLSADRLTEWMADREPAADLVG